MKGFRPIENVLLQYNTILVLGKDLSGNFYDVRKKEEYVDCHNIINTIVNIP